MPESEDDSKNKKHFWSFCEHCGYEIVVCGTCGNGTCSGGFGCNDCKEAYKIWKQGTDDDGW
jgi:hypothetical protein